MDSILKSSNQSLILIFGLCLLVSCASFNPFSGKSGPVSKEIGAEGGSITSADGNVTLAFPAGALSQTEIITIEKINPELLGPEFDEIRPHFTIYAAYELSPDGLKFDVPVQVNIKSEQKSPDIDGSITIEAEIPFTSSGGVLKVLENPGIVRNTDATVTVHGGLTSFSEVIVTRSRIGRGESLVTDRKIEELPLNRRNVLSFAQLQPGVQGEIQNSSINQSFSEGLIVTGFKPLPETSTQNMIDGSTRLTTYSNEFGGPISLSTKGKFEFDGTPIDFLNGKSFFFENKESFHLSSQENPEDEYDFKIVDVSGKFSTEVPNLYTLSASIDIHPELSDKAALFIDWGDGNNTWYKPSVMETTWSQTGPRNTSNANETYVFQASNQYPAAGSYKINVETWTKPSPNSGNEWLGVEESLRRRISNNWQQLANDIYKNPDSDLPSTLGDIFSTHSTPQLNNFTYWPDNPVNPTTEDGRLQIDFSDSGISKDSYPIFNINKVNFGNDSWAYVLDYPASFFEQDPFSLNFAYDEFPQNSENELVRFTMNLADPNPVIIQKDESNTWKVLDNFNSYNPNLSTTYLLHEDLIKKWRRYHVGQISAQILGNTSSSSLGMGGPIVRDRTYGVSNYNWTAGAKIGYSSYNFDSSVGDQTGLSGHTVDPGSLTLGLFTEYDLSNIEWMRNNIGSRIGLSGGISYQYSTIDFEQTLHPQQDFPNRTFGSVVIHELMFYSRIRNLINFKLGDLNFDPYVTLGGGIIWNNGEFTLDYSDGSQETHRRYHNTLFPHAGIGTDVGITDQLGLRLAAGNTFGVGADSNWNVNAGLRYNFCRSNKSN